MYAFLRLVAGTITSQVLVFSFDVLITDASMHACIITIIVLIYDYIIHT